MLEDINLRLEFSTTNSLVFSVLTTGKNIEIHIHMGQYNVMYITLIISDKSLLMHTDKKFLNYIDKLINELEQNLCSFTGFLKRENSEIEVFLHVNFNSIRMNFPPCILYSEEYTEIKNNLANTIFNEIKKINPKQLY